MRILNLWQVAELLPRHVWNQYMLWLHFFAAYDLPELLKSSFSKTICNITMHIMPAFWGRMTGGQFTYPCVEIWNNFMA